MKYADLFYQYNPWWESELGFEDIIRRPNVEQNIQLFLDNKSVIFLTGMRRVGKTTLMKIIIQRLLNKGVDPRHIFYISLDDYLLANQSIIDIVASYRQLMKLGSREHCYIFLDEVAYKENFRQQLKNLYDQGNSKLFVSSSSCSALRDNRGFLTGREYTFEVSPLDFQEFLTFRNIKIKKSDNALMKPYFEEYMSIGGIPEYVLKPRREYLLSLIDDILHKDIIARHNIKNDKIIKDYFLLLMERSGKQISINKVANILGISVDSANRYLKMFEDTYLIHLISRCGKTNERILSPKKIYTSDSGIRNVFTGFRDKGAIFEGIVFNAIKSLDVSYVYQEGIEIDFMIDNKILIEAKYGQQLTGKQKVLFDKIECEKKFLVQNYDDLRELLKLQAQQ